MDNNYRNNLIEFANIYLNTTNFIEDNLDNINSSMFTTFLYKELFNLDINTGYGLDDTTKQMTNNIGDLKIYREDDTNKKRYLSEIKMGDLLFFHTKSLNDRTPSLNNQFPGHVGVYVKDTTFIHLSPTTNKVELDTITDKWLDTLVASRDIIKSVRPF